MQEKNDPECRPQMAKNVKNINQYETIFIGFPIWWHTAPKIINTFIDTYDLTGKKVIPFMTSFGTLTDMADADLKDYCKSKPEWEAGKRFGSVDADILTVKDWINQLSI